ncbi:MAG: hypothetical protein WD689_05450 [Gaiellaceae bacterium]
MSWRPSASTTAASSASLWLSALALAGCGGGPGDHTGYLVDTGREVRLCDALAESYPPQCGGESFRVEGELGAVDWSEAQGVRWTDRPVLLRGEIEDGALRLSETSR